MGPQNHMSWRRESRLLPPSPPRESPLRGPIPTLVLAGPPASVPSHPLSAPPDSAPLLALVPLPTQTCCLCSGPYTRVPSHAALPHAHGKCSRVGRGHRVPRPGLFCPVFLSHPRPVRAQGSLPVPPLLSGATAAQAPSWPFTFAPQDLLCSPPTSTAHSTPFWGVSGVPAIEMDKPTSLSR